LIYTGALSDIVGDKTANNRYTGGTWMNILYETESVCPSCYMSIGGIVFENDEQVFLQKKCRDHGEFTIRIDSHPEMYRKRMDLLFTDSFEYGIRENFHIYLTDKCNLNCPICFAGSKGENRESALADIERFLASNRPLKKITLIGGEPTVRDDIFTIIERIKRYGGEPVLCTNGLKLVNEGFVKGLKESGLLEVQLQFDGLDDDIYTSMRGRALYDEKMKALANLAKHNFKIVIISTIDAGLNDDNMNALLEFSVSNPSINGIVFRTAGASGIPGGKDSLEIFSSDLLQLLDEQTKGRINVSDVESFQEIIMKLVKMFRTTAPACFKDRFYILLRNGKRYTPLGEILPLDEIKELLGIGNPLRPKSVFSLIKRLDLGKMISSRTMVHMLKLFRFFLYQVGPWKKSGFSKDSEVFVIGIAGICDRYSYDKKVVDTCTSSLFKDDIVYDKLPEGFAVSGLLTSRNYHCIN